MKKLLLVAACSLLVLFGAGCNITSIKPVPPRPVACTMEAKLCPDGSYVARSGPNCEFATCPGPKPGITCGSQFGNCSTGFTCIRKCGPPVVRAGDPPPGFYCETNENAKKPQMCPLSAQ